MLDVALMAEYAYREYGDAAEAIMQQWAQKHMLTGPNGGRRLLGEKYPDYFCKAYLKDQFGRDFGQYAVDILDTLKGVIEAPSRAKEAVVAPRGHGKSTLSSFAIPVWATCYQKKRFILFISANYDTSKNFLGKIRKALESADIMEDFGPQQSADAWSAEELRTATGVWVKCAGWKSGLRGMNKDTRPDLIILDDLEDKEVMTSVPLQRKLESCFNDEIGRLGDFNTDYFYIGTLLSEDSLLARTMKNPAWHTLLFKRVISFPVREDLWEEWRKIYCDITDPDRDERAWKFYKHQHRKMTEGVKVLWEDKVPPSSTVRPGAYYNVMLDRVAFGEDAFWQEDQSEPQKTGDRPFKGLTFWNDKPVAKTLRTDLKHVKLVVDPAEGKGADSSAYALGGKLNTGIAVLEGQLRNDALSALMEHVLWFVKSFPEIEEVVIEENTYKQNGTDQLREYLKAHDMPRKVTGYLSESKKYNRIIAMEPDINSGMILFNANNVDFNQQVVRFSGGAAHDDAPDAVQLLWSRLTSSTSAYMDFVKTILMEKGIRT